MIVFRWGAALCFWAMAVFALVLLLRWIQTNAFMADAQILAFSFLVVLGLFGPVLYGAMGLMILSWDHPNANPDAAGLVLGLLVFGVLNGATGPYVTAFFRRDLVKTVRQDDGVTDGFDLLM